MRSPTHSWWVPASGRATLRARCSCARSPCKSLLRSMRTRSISSRAIPRCSPQPTRGVRQRSRHHIRARRHACSRSTPTACRTIAWARHASSPTALPRTSCSKVPAACSHIRMAPGTSTPAEVPRSLPRAAATCCRGCSALSSRSRWMPALRCAAPYVCMARQPTFWSRAGNGPLGVTASELPDAARSLLNAAARGPGSQRI